MVLLPDPSSLAVTVVNTAVTVSITASIALSVGTSIAGGSAGASAGGAVPLILGVQRFTLSSGIAANKTALQTDVADSMGWASGGFNWFGAAPANSSSPTGRRLAIGSAPRGLLLVDPESGRTEYEVRRARGWEARTTEDHRHTL